MHVFFNKAACIFIRREGLILHARSFQEPEVEPDDFSDETHLIVDGNDDPAILLISPSPPRPLGRVHATSVPPRLLSTN